MEEELEEATNRIEELENIVKLKDEEIESLKGQLGGTGMKAGALVEGDEDVEELMHEVDELKEQVDELKRREAEVKQLVEIEQDKARKVTMEKTTMERQVEELKEMLKIANQLTTPPMSEGLRTPSTSFAGDRDGGESLGDGSGGGGLSVGGGGTSVGSSSAGLGGGTSVGSGQKKAKGPSAALKSSPKVQPKPSLSEEVGQTEAQTEAQAEGQAEGQTEGQTEGEAEGQAEGEAEGQTAASVSAVAGTAVSAAVQAPTPDVAVQTPDKGTAAAEDAAAKQEGEVKKEVRVGRSSIGMIPGGEAATLAAAAEAQRRVDEAAAEKKRAKAEAAKKEMEQFNALKKRKEVGDRSQAHACTARVHACACVRMCASIGRVELPACLSITNPNRARARTSHIPPRHAPSRCPLA